jgi:hypothetical protein
MSGATPPLQYAFMAWYSVEKAQGKLYFYNNNMGGGGGGGGGGSSSMGTWAFSPGKMLPGRDANHPPPPNAKVKKVWRCTCTPPYTFMT